MSRKYCFRHVITFDYLQLIQLEWSIRYRFDILSIIERYDLQKCTNTVDHGVHRLTNLLPRPLMRLRSIHITSYHLYISPHISYPSWLHRESIFMSWCTATPAAIFKNPLGCGVLFSWKIRQTVPTFIYKAYLIKNRNSRWLSPS